ncbi:MAG: T9SS type A sorting domain-containing protein [Clostridium sp.]|nr:T9SS type A sorting domain-containing protein [Clostridium sp.]
MKQLYTNAEIKNEDVERDPTLESYRSLEHLMDESTTSIFRTSPYYDKDYHYLSVRFADGLPLPEDKSLYVVLTRPQRPDENTPTKTNPTALEIHYSLNDNETSYMDTVVLARVYFINRGSGTTELSEPLSYQKLDSVVKKYSGAEYSVRDIKRLKFIVTMNNGRYTVGDTDIRPMILAGFQLYAAKPYDLRQRTGDLVVNNWVDRFHLDTDINFRYYDFDFVHTQGVLDSRNRQGVETHQFMVQDDDNNNKTLNALPGWDKFDANGIWTADTAFMRKNNIRMPDYSYITCKDDSLIRQDHKMQQTATIEHLVYAVQGEPIALYPYYTMPYPEKGNYQEKFIHWYDYYTGGQLTDDSGHELLGFHADASQVFRSKDHGWYSGMSLTTDQRYDTTIEPFTIASEKDYIEYVRLVNEEGKTGLNAVITADVLDFKGMDVEPIGNSSSRVWYAQLDGGNCIIKNLVIENNYVGSGLIGNATDGALVQNLIIDSSCSFTGLRFVGLVGAFRKKGMLTIRGIVNNADVTARGSGDARTAGSLLGCATELTDGGSSSVFLFENCIVAGNIVAPSEAALVAGWISGAKTTFRNIVVTGTVTGNANWQDVFRATVFNDRQKFKNCYINRTSIQNFSRFDGNVTVLWLKSALSQDWSGVDATPIAPRYAPVTGGAVIAGHSPERQYGTWATFFHTREPFSEDGNLRPLCKNEFVIAADVAQDFSYASNITDNGDGTGTIIEPTIQVRHLFRVRDGRQFADDYMKSSTGNEEFIRMNRRHISASTKTFFQVRLDHPYPAETTTRGVFYYKINDEDYRRICSRIIRVIHNGDTIQETRVKDTFAMDESERFLKFDSDGNPIPLDYSKSDPTQKIMFYPTGMFNGQGMRTVVENGDSVNYYLCGGGGHYFQMLACKAENIQEPGDYTVQVIGTDFDGEIIYLYDDLQKGIKKELMVQEFKIKFLPPESSLFIPEEELAEPNSIYDDLTNEQLTLKYGPASDIINFDEYLLLENPDNLKESTPDMYIRTLSMNDNQNPPKYAGEFNYFRWPQPWEQTNYNFGYNVRHDYAMQMIANNSMATSHHSYVYKEGEQRDNYGEGPGLYDRLFYESADHRKGYFYYVNAADDPGIIARLKLDKFCPGSKVHVSCWIAEFTNNRELANLSFNFVARMTNGERIPLHSHITGYVPTDRRGQWMYVYSAFVPDLTDKRFDMDRLLRYEIEIENNAKSSLGADYAVDDIRVYTVSPDIEAYQENPICLKEDNIDVRISADFESLMQSLGIEPVDFDNNRPAENQGKMIDLYYTFVDHEIYENLKNQGFSPQERFDSAVIRYNYDGVLNGPAKPYGTLSFRSCWVANDEYIPGESTTSNKAFRYVSTRPGSSGRELIVFNTDPSTENMNPGKKYICAMYTKLNNEDFGEGVKEPGWNVFLLEDSCSKKCVFTVVASSIIRINGEVKNVSQIIDACKNQIPNVQVDLLTNKMDENGNPVVVKHKAVFDWYEGPMKEFEKIHNNAEEYEHYDKGVTLWDALIFFRETFPKAEDLSDEPPVNSQYTEEMRELIDRYVRQDSTGNVRPKLILAKPYYNFPRLNLSKGKTDSLANVLAIPIPLYYKEEQDSLGVDDDGEAYKICTMPTDVEIQVRQRAPIMYQGFSSIKYPDAIEDVPMRLSLKRANMAYAPITDTESAEAPIMLPVRQVIPVSKDVTAMRIPLYDGAPLELIATDDPDYLTLSDSDIHDSDSQGMWKIGELIELEAIQDKEAEGRIGMVFYNDSIRFKEGYYYTVKFPFEEKTGTSSAPADISRVLAVNDGSPDGYGEDSEEDKSDDTNEEICHGDVIFTLKIVPEYQKWTGKANKNWNNDDNWRRVTDSELLDPENASLVDLTINDLSNPNVKSYAPLDFTRVIIPQPVEVSDDEETEGELATTVPHMFQPKNNPRWLDGIEREWNSDPSANATAGFATLLVQYDMIQLPKNDATYCRPWVANMSREIHFESGAEIANQQWLRYERAWVDMEVDPMRWYVLSSPLKATFAGDMYLPTAGARQLTPYFREIEFEYGEDNAYNRFKPAVFQRSWDQARANVYNFGDDPEAVTNVGVLTTWSNVYNDVNVPYETGHGFSVKADITEISGTKPEKVMFRLPKNDDSYSYFTDNGQSDPTDDTHISRTDPYRLNDVTGRINLTAASDSNRFYMVGNPFMAHMDMKAFLEKNEKKIQQKYWILDGSRQGAAVMSGNTFVGTLDAPEYVAPMQGFFVELTEDYLKQNGGTAVSLDYDTTMIATVNDGIGNDNMLSRSSAGIVPMRISALESGSTAVMVVDPDADSCYDSQEDAILVNDPSLESSLVYTVAGVTATTVNQLPEIVRTEIGVVAAAGEETTLLFEGVDESLGLMLYDTSDESYTTLVEGMTLQVSGPVAGRLYIVDEAVSSLEEQQIEITLLGSVVRVASFAGGLSARVFDTMGRLVDSNYGDGSESEFTLERGIYIIEAIDDVSSVTKKVLVK